MSDLIYTAFLTPESDGGYSVRFPQFDGCFTQGDSLEESYWNAKEALGLHIQGMAKDGEVIPAPNRTIKVPDGCIAMSIPLSTLSLVSVSHELKFSFDSTQ